MSQVYVEITLATWKSSLVFAKDIVPKVDVFKLQA
jgi:hypothetical protein